MHKNIIFTALLILLGLLAIFAVSAKLPENQKQKQFRFFINADPQMGEAETKIKALKKLNQLLYNFVDEVNQEHAKEEVDFVVYNGDLVYKVKPQAFNNFSRLVRKQKPPVVLVHGNHDGTTYDDNFIRIQQELSGYQELNYSFAYGDWQFIVIAAQEKYESPAARKKQLEWLKSELAKYKTKNVMLFMHYHIMPVGLSQMEYYSYWPDSFKHQILNAITEHGNVKYVFSGHVHSGVKASVKSSVAYKGTQFIVSPTPVMARPFGEEYANYEKDPSIPFFRRGFYLEVKVSGSEVELIGHKIGHDFEVKYPKSFQSFDAQADLRFFRKEGLIKPAEMSSLALQEGNPTWMKSYRYNKDPESSYINVFKEGKNHLTLNSPWGAWTFDEYHESYASVPFETKKDQALEYVIKTPEFDKRGGGGFIRAFVYAQNGKASKQIILYWGAQFERMKFTYQSLFYHAEGSRINPNYIDKKIQSGQLFLQEIKFDPTIEEHHLKLNLSAIIRKLNESKSKTKSKSTAKFSHMIIGHGVWSRVTKKGAAISSELTVNEVTTKGIDRSEITVMLNDSDLSGNKNNLSNPFYKYQ
ncbi:metallophosphoesterase [Marinicella sp. S1101]|uniref:metallophosphoesterase family protein n=1 Tax=Marinicella marina TaxID=2996016 RepID=UPI002260DB49|nr:metallophosphoesterase [Marinicella marina]MCX7552948.1 metallophosphoesterase [Marinicella marina]MDJ1139742.1 metallophosphoesterase [Marinicella marina]